MKAGTHNGEQYDLLYDTKHILTHTAKQKITINIRFILTAKGSCVGRYPSREPERQFQQNQHHKRKTRARESSRKITFDFLRTVGRGGAIFSPALVSCHKFPVHTVSLQRRPPPPPPHDPPVGRPQHRVEHAEEEKGGYHSQLCLSRSTVQQRYRASQLRLGYYTVLVQMRPFGAKFPFQQTESGCSLRDCHVFLALLVEGRLRGERGVDIAFCCLILVLSI